MSSSLHPRFPIISLVGGWWLELVRHTPLRAGAIESSLPASRMRFLPCAAPTGVAAARAPGRRFGLRRVVADCAASAHRDGEGAPPPRSACLPLAAPYTRKIFNHVVFVSIIEQL